MKEIELQAIEAVQKIMEGATELTDVLLEADNGVVDEVFNSSRATDIYADVFCRSFDELDICVWGETLIKEIEKRSHKTHSRWKVICYGGGKSRIEKCFPAGKYDEMIDYFKSISEDYLVAEAHEYNEEASEYKLLFASRYF